MQDRFKFRVWSIANKKYCHFATMDLSADGLLRVIRPLEQSEYIDDYENRYVIQQCTGLKDKNGKLIYEGDIVKVNDKVTAVIEFYRGIFGCRFDSQYKNFERFLGVGAYSDFEIEVIGNRYENPELLED